MPAEFGVHFLPLTKNVPNRTKLHLNEIGLNNTEICKSQSQLRQPPISWKIRYFSTFCDTGVRLNVAAMLCILCKYGCTRCVRKVIGQSRHFVTFQNSCLIF